MCESTRDNPNLRPTPTQGPAFGTGPPLTFLSHPHGTLHVMPFILNSELTVECAYCSKEFTHPRRPGRRRVYCRRSCRQRAYEHRHHIAPRPRPHPAGSPTTNDARATPPPSYAEGHTRFIYGKHHAVITGPPDGKHRFPTLCGLHAHPGPRSFSHLRGDSCKTCAAISHTRPPTTAHRPQHQLLAAQHHLTQTANGWRRAQHFGTDQDPETLSNLLRHALEPVGKLIELPRWTQQRAA